MQRVQPQVEETVTGGKLDRHGSQATVLGICSYTEDSVSCWAPDGKPNAGLTGEVTAKMDEIAQAPQRHGTISYNLDGLNRIVVTEVKSTPGKPGAFAIERVEAVNVMNGISLNNPKFDPNKPVIQRSMQFFSVKPGTKSFSLIAGQALSPVKGMMLDFKQGATASEGSFSAKILSLEMAEPPQNNGRGGGNFRSVTIKIEVKGLTGKLQPNLITRLKQPPPDQMVEISKSWVMPMLTIQSRDGDVFTATGYLEPDRVTGLGLSFYELHRYRLGGLPIKP